MKPRRKPWGGGVVSTGSWVQQPQVGSQCQKKQLQGIWGTGTKFKLNATDVTC